MSPLLDRDTLRAPLAALEATVRQLDRHGGVTSAELQRDVDLRWAICHGLQLAIQGVLDIGTHLGTVLGRVSDQYKDAVLALGDVGVLDRSFAERLADMAGFRDILVHGYLRLELGRVADALHHLDDFRAFAAAVAAFLAANPDL